jgi:hypothetical protein
MVVCLCGTSVVLAQDKSTKPHAAAKPATSHGKKHKRHKKATKVITHGSDNDQKLKDIKDAKNKEKSKQ